jgi:hypothetical protein
MSQNPELLYNVISRQLVAIVEEIKCLLLVIPSRVSFFAFLVNLK